VNWQSFQNNMPSAPVSWIVVQETFNDLVISTYGRGIWILDDLGPLQQLSPDVLDADTHLFPPRVAYRFRGISREASATNDPTVGENPPYGASINYYLKTPPEGDVTVTILDPQGEAIRTLRGPKAAGLNRITWDLEHEPSKQVRLRTSPLYAPDVEVGPDGWRSAPGTRQLSILAPPGTYTVRLNAGSIETTRNLEVRKDPHSAGTEDDIRAQIAMLMELRDDMDQATDMINQIELLRSQIYALSDLTDDATVAAAGDELDQRLIAVESSLVELRMTGRGQDGVRWGSRLQSKLGYLANGLASGDFRPTDQQIEVQAELEDELRDSLRDLDGLLSQELSAFNDMLGQNNLPIIVVRPPS